MSDLNKVDELVIRNAMRKMLTGQNWFSISTVRECVKLAGIVPPPKTMDRLATLHCMNYSEMDPELLAMLPDMLREVFSGVRWSDMFAEPAASNVVPLVEPETKGFFARLKIGG